MVPVPVIVEVAATAVAFTEIEETETTEEQTTEITVEEPKYNAREDENSDVSWIDIDKTIEVSREEQMKVIYQKLNDKLRIINNKGSEQ